MASSRYLLLMGLVLCDGMIPVSLWGLAGVFFFLLIGFRGFWRRFFHNKGLSEARSYV